MNVFLAGTATHEKLFVDAKLLYVLESFLFVKPWQTKRIHECKAFFLDSGAFTFIRRKKCKFDLSAYVQSYIDYINENDVQYFFELDIDAIIGYDDVLQIRKKIISDTGKTPIPVWHLSRGISEFRNMCSEFPYVAVGGLATKEIASNNYDLFNQLIDIAHKAGCKIHGLGFTNPVGLQKCKFDSVDSTSWTAGRRFGRIFVFNGKTLTQKVAQNYSPYLSRDQLDSHNLKTWIWFQSYAERNL